MAPIFFLNDVWYLCLWSLDSPFQFFLCNGLKGIEICVILYPLHVFYLSSCPLKNSLYSPFSVIQFASIAFSFPPPEQSCSSIPPSFSPSLPHATTMLEDSLCRPNSPCVSLITLCWSTHYCVSVPHFSVSLTFCSLISQSLITHTCNMVLYILLV